MLMDRDDLSTARTVSIRRGDLDSNLDQRGTLTLLDLYASQLPGRCSGLSADTQQKLIPALRNQPGLQLFLAESASSIVGVAICFEGFSTFKAQTLLNIHDFTIHPAYRGQGIGSQLLEHVIQYARQVQHCAVTLEVLASNPARRLYTRHGFEAIDGPCADHLMLFGKLELD
jgi:ribosomal protein S18 acetylase RimI-like enzyme